MIAFECTPNDLRFHFRDIEKIRDGIAEKASYFLFLVMSFSISIAISFICGWKLSLIMVSYIPIVIIINTIMGKVSSHAANALLIGTALNHLFLDFIQFQTSLSVKEKNSYSAAANVAEEAISGIRTVFAFNGEKVEVERYNKRLIDAKRAVRMKGLLTGFSEGISRFLAFSAFGVGYWYGVKLVLEDHDKVDKEYTPANLMIVCTQ